MAKRQDLKVIFKQNDQHQLMLLPPSLEELVSQGHTNNEVGRQLFISRHTVAFHLKKVYQKMSIASRVELAASWKAMQ